ncbi:Holliday junction resolvase RuvX [Oerskovia sp. M15]
MLGGGGGGKDDMAQGGGTDVSALGAVSRVSATTSPRRSERAADGVRRHQAGTLSRGCPPGRRRGQRPRRARCERPRRSDRDARRDPCSGHQDRGSGPDDATSPMPSDVARIAAEVEERGAGVVYIGLPRHLSGAEGAATQVARAYAGLVARAVAPVPVHLVDERMTTVSAHQALRASGRAGRKQRSVVDQAAAVIILQTALDRERSAGRAPEST